MFSYNTETAEILIYDVIGEEYDGSGVHASGVAEALDAMDGQRVTVRINSPGGVADEGIAIYNTLKRYAGGVDTVIDSLAASAASIVALAGERRTTLAGSRWMIHNAIGAAIGNAAAMRKLAEVLDVYDNSLADIYSGYMGKSTGTILDMMASETWFNSAASLQAGLSTALVETPATQKPRMAAWFEHAPKDEFTTPAAKLKIQPVARELARQKLRLAGK